MKHILLVSALFILPALLIAGCSPNQECNAGPCLAATATAISIKLRTAETGTPAAPLPSTVAPTVIASPSPTPTSYDGFWDGSTNDGALAGAFQFMVENNKVTDIVFNYTLRNGGCTYISALDGTADESFIEGDKLHTTMFIKGGNVLTFNGTFTAAKQANGTLTYKGTLEDCGAFEKTAPWTAKNIPIPPTVTPTPIPPTDTPTLTPTTTEPPPTKSTVAPTMESQNVPEEIQPLINAINQSKGASSYRLAQELARTENPASNSADDAARTVSRVDEINSPDRRTILQGASAATFGADPDKGLEYILVDGKAYVHGPARTLGATQAKWYRLDSIPRGTALDNDPLYLLNLFTPRANFWSHVERARRGVTLDGQTCDVYVADQTAFAEFAAGFDASASAAAPPVLEEGSLEMYVCADGHLHQLNAHAVWRDGAASSRKRALTLAWRMSAFGNILIQPPPMNDARPSDATRTPTAFDTEFPLPEDVENFDSGGAHKGQINFQTISSIEELVAFYRRVLTAKGLQEETAMTTIDAETFSIVFSGWKPGKWLVIQGVNLNATRNVNMRLEDAR